MNLDQNIHDSKSHIWNSFFENITLGIQLFHIGPHIAVDIIRVFFLISDFLKANKNLRKKSLILQYIFPQKTSLILQISTHLTLKTICSHNTAKNFSHFTNFPANTFLFGPHKMFCNFSF